MISFVDALAALHNLDVDELALSGFARSAEAPKTTPVSISRCGRSSPTTACRTSTRSCATPAHGCTRTRPSTWPAPCSCRVTPGPGNFVFENGKVTGIVDWEFAHVGDPMDDWAWLDMRMPDADLTELQDRYTRATGIAIDHERIRYYRAAVDYRCAVTTSLAVAAVVAHVGGRPISS